MEHRDAGKVLELDERELDPVSPVVSALVAADGLGTRLPARGSMAYPFVFQSISDASRHPSSGLLSVIPLLKRC